MNYSLDDCAFAIHGPHLGTKSNRLEWWRNYYPTVSVRSTPKGRPGSIPGLFYLSFFDFQETLLITFQPWFRSLSASFPSSRSSLFGSFLS